MFIHSKTRAGVLSILQVIFVFSLTILVAGYFSFLGVDPHHDGTMIKPASDIARGQMLFRDTFSQYGAIATILQSFAFMVFGHYLYVANLLTVIFYGLVGVMLYLVWRIFLSGWISTLACIIWILLASYVEPGFAFLPWSSVYALFFQLLTLYALLRFMKGGGIKWQVLAGVSCALTFWTRQPVGFLLTGSIIAYFILLKLKKYKFSSLVPLLASNLFTHLAFFGWLIFNGALLDWYYQTIQYPAIWSTAASKEKVVLFMNFATNIFPRSYGPLSIWTILPLCVLTLGYLAVRRRKLTSRSALVLLAVCVNLASWAQYHPVSDIRHLYWAGAPMIGFALYAAVQADANRGKGIVFLIICLLLFFPDIFYNLRLARRKIRRYWSYPTLSRPALLKNMKVSPEAKKFYDDASTQIDIFKKARPDSFILSVGRDSIFSLFDGGNRNCHQLTVDWGWNVYIPQQERTYKDAIQSCLKKYRPAVFTSRKYLFPQGYRKVTGEEPETQSFLLVPHE